MAARSSSTESADLPADSDAASETSARTTDAASPYLPRRGEHALAMGQNGSGKTAFTKFLMMRLENSPTVIYDTKHEPKFLTMPHSRLVTNLTDANEAVDDPGVDYVVLRPEPHITADPASLDELLQHHEANWRGVDAYLDEAYHFHRGGRAGPGLIGLYTRGRSRGITTLASTQRPAWISGFMFSETRLFYVFRLTRKSDRKRVADFIEGFDELPPPTGHQYYFYRDGGEAPQLMKPIPLTKEDDTGYTDIDPETGVTAPEPGDPEGERPTSRIPHVWF